MLAYFDTIFGFSVIMLGISLLITILNQIVSGLFAHRGANLRWGLETLFKQTGPKVAGYPILAQKARVLSEIVLTHPLISDSIFSTNPKSVLLVRKRPGLFGLLKRWQLASGIKAAELASVLQHVVDNRPPDLPMGIHAALRHELNRWLQQPSTETVRAGALAAAGGPAPPALAVQVAGNSPAAGNLDALHDQIMDRVSQRFTTRMRIWTVGFAFTIAGTFCVDSVKLIRGIYKNDGARAQLVNAAPQTVATALQVTAGVSDNDKRMKEAGQLLSTVSTQCLPEFSPVAWKDADEWTPLGVLISALLLSLGAPFWFNTLKSLTSLRPLLAGSSSQSANKPA